MELKKVKKGGNRFQPPKIETMSLLVQEVQASLRYEAA